MSYNSPTLFFTLSATNTKWNDLHKVVIDKAPSNANEKCDWTIQNIIKNPHLTYLYMHHRFTIFHEKVQEKC